MEPVSDGIAALAATGGPRAVFSLRPARPAPLPDVGELLAGAAEADLTPPPGMPRAGYSRNAHTGTGFRTRLRARVVHLRAGTSSVAIVATDLLGGSAVVQHLVALRLAASTDVPLAGLFLGATHTHGAPGQFHGTPFYNRFSSDRPGFDPAWTAFLAMRIAAAVEAAVAGRRPAALAWGRTQVRGLTRNRSLPAHRRNPGAAARDAASAVNPWLDLLRVDASASDGGTEPLAALAVFSVHGTAVPMSSRSYNADVWAYLCDELADRVAATHGRRPVTGALQGTHGDVTPALRGPAGHPEAARIGAGIGAAAAELWAGLDGRLERRPRLAAGFREVDLRGAPETAGWLERLPRPLTGMREDGRAETAGWLDGVRLPRRPAVGAALMAGAKENETPGVTLLPPFRAGTPKPAALRRGPHREKWVVGSARLQPLLLPLDGFPRVLPVHLVRAGGVLLTGLPMEITTESGRRIAAAAEAGWAAGGGDPVRAVVSSVVDEYAGYCTTDEEYGAQFYEGGHTLYGPATQRFLAGCAGELAGVLARDGSAQQSLPERRFSLPVRRYLARPTGRAGDRRALHAPAAVAGSGAHEGAEGYVEWRWADAPPGDLCWHRPLVRVEVAGREGWRSWVDDGRGALEVVHLGADPGGGGRYAARWYGTAPAGRYRFVLAGGGVWSSPAARS